ncbi:septum site-determining protein MinC [Falsiroseomonas selenitidurans]|uniref:Probable septum site-determining protein MinC n=1 Tax=Falsiroseomonas selenitidurans TaxID=2716335 RepID=A0ABX1E6S3_9PROT|nr:septum site-determining protein MinC [Falsiroseomonas selenitidurans]NKC32889.1 septum site-determining protein MinC [Falsiroseomonas selenitidurans]OYW09466.1 MAG: septum site-determining protein MinC [Rhodospirillales bacterium 12-71-4]
MSAASSHPAPRLEPFRLRGANFNLLVMRLLDHRVEALVPALGDQFRRAPGFLRFAPVVIGLDDIPARPEDVDFAGLVQGLRAIEIVPIGTTGGTPEMRNAAVGAGLPPLRLAGGGREEDVALAAQPSPPQPAPPPPAAPVAAMPAAMVVDQPVRAGQRIWAQGTDLIIVGTVNRGAEVIADGNIHVYGRLLGRAIAGGQDNAAARVFALHFDPELVSIAGYYAVREGLGEAPIGKTVQARLVGEHMRFDPVG